MSKSRNKAEREHLTRVAELGCVACRNAGLGETPAEIHHIRAGQGRGQRASDYDTIPLCPWHHRQGGHGKAIHAGQQAWEEKFGTELELLAQVRSELGVEA